MQHGLLGDFLRVDFLEKGPFNVTGLDTAGSALMQTLEEQFNARLNAFLDRTGLSPTTLGMKAVGDPNLLRQIERDARRRSGRRTGFWCRGADGPVAEPRSTTGRRTGASPGPSD